MIGDGHVRFSEEGGGATRSPLLDKYALALDLTAPGFDPSVLCEFRARRLRGGLEALLLETLLARLQEQGLLKARGRQRTDGTHVLAAVRAVGRLVTVGETLRAALNALATAAPDWLQAQVAPDWFDRYSRRVEEYRLPKTDAARAALAAVIGADGHQLLGALYALTAPAALRLLPAVQILRAVWVQQFYAPDASGAVRWREAGDQPPSARLIISPYDPEAHLSTKQDYSWVGTKVHVTETCDEDTPHLITHVETTPATTQDEQALAPIHTALAAQGLLPQEHLVDSGYVDSERVRTSREQYAVRLVGPMPVDGSWQAHAGQGYAAACLAIDWAAQRVTCPAGQQSRLWNPKRNKAGAPVIQVQFAPTTCAGCAVREQCTKASKTGRSLTLLPQEAHLAVAAGRAAQQTPAFKAEYAARAGIEGTLSQGLRLGDLRQTRYRGAAKTRLQHILIAVAVNLLRLVAWWQGRARAHTRVSAFAALAFRPPPIRAAAAG